jgi:hypothetical protein
VRRLAVDAPPKLIKPVTVTAATAHRIIGLSDTTVCALIKRKKIGVRSSIISRSKRCCSQMAGASAENRIQLGVTFERDDEEPERLRGAGGWRAAIVAVGLIISAVPCCWVIGGPVTAID